MLDLENLVIVQGSFALRTQLSVAEGAAVAVIGPSGAGKSTLLSAIAGFLDPLEGQIAWAGARLDGLAPAARPTAMLFQDQNLFPHLTVAQNIGLGIAPSPRAAQKHKERIEGVLAEVGLEGFGARKPAALSGGQQSRAALARVLLQDKPLVLLDEPFAALGPGLRSEMTALTLSKLRAAGRTVLAVTHQPEDAGAFDQVIFVNQGRAEWPVSAAAFFGSARPEVKSYLGLA